MWQTDLTRLEQDAASNQPEIREKAMLELSQRARKEPKLRARLMPIFRDAVERPRDGWTTASALGGIDQLCGLDEGRRLRIPFFGHLDPEMACPAILTAPDAGCVLALIETVLRRTEPKVRIAILQTFGRLRDPAAIDAIVHCLAFLDERPHAIEALGNIGNPRAIPYLQQWLHDPTPTWPIDDRGGAMMSVGDMAGYAIGKIGFYTRRVGVAPNSTIADAAAAPMPSLGGPIPKYTIPAPVFGAPLSPPGRLRRWGAVLTFVPLAAALFLIPWIFVIVILSLDSQGHLTNTPKKTHLLDLMSAIPPILGLAAGAFVVLRCRPLQVWQWIILAIGCGACGLACFSFGWEFFH